MDQLTIILAQPFKQHAKRELSAETFNFTLTLTLGWLTPQQAKEVMSMGASSGLITVEKGKVRAVFEPGEIEIPNGFKPDFESLKPHGIPELLSRLIKDTGGDPDMLEEKTDDVLKRYHKLLDRDAARLIAAAELGADVSELAGRVESRLRGNLEESGNDRE